MPTHPDTGFAAFASLLTRLLGRDVDLSLQSHLTRDLELDSFDLFELIVAIEDATGMELYGDALPEITTVGDAYELWSRARC